MVLIQQVLQISEKKIQLKYLCLMNNWDHIPVAVHNSVTLFVDWDWEFSASKFFTVDRSLVAGVNRFILINLNATLLINCWNTISYCFTGDHRGLYVYHHYFSVDHNEKLSELI